MNGLLGSVRGSRGGGPIIRIPTPNSSRMKKLPPCTRDLACDRNSGEEEDHLDLAEENARLKNELDKIKAEHAREIEELYAEQNQTLEDYAREREELLAQIQSQSITDLTMTGDSMDLENAHRIADLEEELEEEKSRIIEMETVLKEELDKNSALESELKTLKQLHYDQLKEKDAEISEMKEKIDNPEVQKRLRDAEEEIEDLKEALLHSTGNDDIKRKQEEIDSLKEELKDARQEIRDLKAQLENMAKSGDTEKALINMQNEITKLKNYENEILEIKNENKQLKDQITEMKQQAKKKSEQAGERHSRIPLLGGNKRPITTAGQRGPKPERKQRVWEREQTAKSDDEPVKRPKLGGAAGIRTSDDEMPNRHSWMSEDDTTCTNDDEGNSVPAPSVNAPSKANEPFQPPKPNRRAMESHIQFGQESDSEQVQSSRQPQKMKEATHMVYEVPKPQRRAMECHIQFDGGEEPVKQVSAARKVVQNNIEFRDDVEIAKQAPKANVNIDEIRAKVDKLCAERSEIERKLSKAFPKEKGAKLAQLRAEREEMEVQLESVTKEISKLKLELHYAQQK